MNNKQNWCVVYPDGHILPCNTRSEASTKVRRYNSKHKSKNYFDRAMVLPLETKVIEQHISVFKKVLNYIIGKV